jgi:hemolysin activation/secretion protein
MRKIFIMSFAIFLLCGHACAASIPQGQDIGSRVREYENEKMRQEVNKELAAPRQNAPSLDAAPIEALPAAAAAVYVTRITIQKGPGVKISDNDKTLAKLASGYENKALSLEDMKTLAGAITNKIADREIEAYIPRQSFDEGVMYIHVVKKD